MKLRNLLSAARDTLFPHDFTCDICGVETFGESLCSDCLKKVVFNDGATCFLCGRKTVYPGICLNCKEKPPLFEKAVSALSYDGISVTLIHKFKSGSGYLKEYFAGLLAEKLGNFPDYDGIIFVPMTKKAERRRGYNQSKLLAKSLSERVQKPVICDALKKVKDSSAQKTLTGKERADNLRGCFMVVNKDEIKGKNLLLVDDVLTTGATANEITKVLLKAGAKEIYVATAASVEYKMNAEINLSDVKRIEPEKKKRLHKTSI